MFFRYSTYWWLVGRKAMSKTGRTTEEQMAVGVAQIAYSKTDKIATHEQIRNEIPKYVNLTAEDEKVSKTRPNEPMWHQIIRNIQSHYETGGNFIYKGYLEHVRGVGFRVTDEGVGMLKAKKLI